MRQILFDIPLGWLNPGWHIPIYGYGLMLFLAYVFCTQLGKYLCRRERIDPEIIPDLTIWLFVGGIVGSRAVFVIQYWDQVKEPWHILRVWDGGLVFYGGVIGGAIAYLLYDRRVLSKLNVSKWKMLDVAAPCIALGAALGRIGCLCTGCCYGNVACETCTVPVHFPLSSPAAGDMLRRGYQTPQGFVFAGNSNEVAVVEPGSAAATAGLRPGDVIVKINGDPVKAQADVTYEMGEMKLTVLRGRESRAVELAAFEPSSIGLHPTQLYDVIGMLLLMLFLLSYFPYRRRHGELMVFLMFGYGVHRFLSEMLRTDTDPVLFGLTLSQNISIAVVLAGAVLAYAISRRPLIADEPPPVLPAPPETPVTQETAVKPT